MSSWFGPSRVEHTDEQLKALRDVADALRAMQMTLSDCCGRVHTLEQEAKRPRDDMRDKLNAMQQSIDTLKRESKRQRVVEHKPKPAGAWYRTLGPQPDATAVECAVCREYGEIHGDKIVWKMKDTRKAALPVLDGEPCYSSTQPEFQEGITFRAEHAPPPLV